MTPRAHESTAKVLAALAANPDRAEAAVRSHARLTAVQRSRLLDTPAEESFDVLTQLAQRLLKVPASFLSLVGEEHDFYKSQAGFSAPLSETRKLIGPTFCHYALLGEGTLAIEDTLSNPVWASVPTVESMGVRAYAGVPLRVDGEVIGSFCAIDVVPRQWTQAELETLEQLAVSAGREVALRLALAAAHEQTQTARALALSREQMVAGIAHDIRTPLQVVHLGAHVLQRTPRSEQEAALVARMANAVSAMRAMADGLLADSSAPAGQREPVTAVALGAAAVDMMDDIARRAGIRLRLCAVAPAMLTVNYAQLLRVLGNVIGNAVKYSPAGSEVCLAGTSREGGRFVWTVADQGHGMSAADLANVWTQGWQGAAGLARGDGAGLGLAIVERIVKEHGGSVSIDSAPGRGTSVALELPCTGCLP